MSSASRVYVAVGCLLAVGLTAIGCTKNSNEDSVPDSSTTTVLSAPSSSGLDGAPESPVVEAALQGCIASVACPGADLRGLLIEGAELPGADLSGVDLRAATIRRSNLSQSKLNGANVAGAELSYTDLRGADLSDATFAHASLEGVDLTGATDIGTNWSDVMFCNTTMPDGTSRSEGCEATGE